VDQQQAEEQDDAIETGGGCQTPGGRQRGMKTRGKVVLFYPAYEGPALSAPLCLLSLASPLRNAGFQVVIVDAAIHPDYLDEIKRQVHGAICLGISLLTGPMILGAIEVASASKKLRPELPVIFGGWHPSLLPQQTLKEPFVDIVVCGQGEVSLLEVVETLASGRPINDVPGVMSKGSGLHLQQSSRRLEWIANLPTPAFEMVNFNAYERVCGTRKLAYATSVGCPYACNYCTDMVFYKRRFNALPSERVISEMTDLADRYQIEEIALLDSNFPVDLRRAKEIARGIHDSRVKFRWTFQASTDFLCRMSDDEVRLLGASGVSHMGFGTESTSEAVLKLMNKRHQRVNEMFETARKAEIAGIHVTFNLILGYPGETEADRVQTFQTMSDIAREFWNVSFSPNIFTPYPGIPIWPQLRELGVREPQSLCEWASLPLGANVLPWLRGREMQRLNRMLEYFLLNNQIRSATQHSPRLRTGVRRLLGAPLRWRIRRNKYSFPWELWVARSTERLVTRRSLITGQPLPQEGATC
jgi:anaerobic magnesium-protoporphyrin IX monomethyl ester cyclase